MKNSGAAITYVPRTVTTSHPVVEAWNPPINWIKSKIEMAGNSIGSVHFIKRSDNTLRKMTYRLHVRKPTIAKTPKSFDTTKNNRKILNRRYVDNNNLQMTVLDTNKVVRDEDGNIKGRGAWRTLPLDRITKITNKKVTYIIHRTFQITK